MTKNCLSETDSWWKTSVNLGVGEDAAESWRELTPHNRWKTRHLVAKVRVHILKEADKTIQAPLAIESALFISCSESSSKRHGAAAGRASFLLNDASNKITKLFC